MINSDQIIQKRNTCDKIVGDIEPDQTEDNLKKRQRKKREITNCQHTDQKHYAKGMCNHCYHLYGRKGKANKCEHTDKHNYARGMCQQCYFNFYNTT